MKKYAKKNFDHIRCGKYTTLFVLPPKKDGDIEVFRDQIFVVAIKKIQELQKHYSQIRKIYKNNEPQLLNSKIDISINIRYLLAKFGYEKEKYYISKWIQYWKDLIGIKRKNNYKDKLDIESAKNYPIEDLYNGELRQVTNRLQGLCPLHSEETPSFFIFENNHFYCFGCHEHGSSIDFLMKTKNLDFVSAVKELQK